MPKKTLYTFFESVPATERQASTSSEDKAPSKKGNQNESFGTSQPPNSGFKPHWYFEANQDAQKDEALEQDLKYWEEKRMQQAAKTPALTTRMGITWFKALQSEFEKPYFMKLSTELVNARQKYEVCPLVSEVYSWTEFCEIQDVKVVIIGQDPYHTNGLAHGLAFSVRPYKNTPPSLRNIYSELKRDLPDFVKPSHGYLEGWAKQGVLLLNASLTVVANKANSHSDIGWQNLTDAVIKWISANLDGVVFMMWGACAQKKMPLINEIKHKILTASHPSPLSASRGFFGCSHFSQANKYLEKKGKTPINWSHFSFTVVGGIMSTPEVHDSD